MDGLLLLFALLTVQDLVGLPTYELENFHYTDEDHKFQAIPLTNKLYMEYSDDKDIQQAVWKVSSSNVFPTKKIERIVNSRLDGIIWEFDTHLIALEALNKLPFMIKKKGFIICPIVDYRGTESVIFNQIIVKVNDSITELNFQKRLNFYSDCKIRILGKLDFDANVYNLNIVSFNAPTNVIVFSNLLANDRAWIKWSRPLFIPIHGFINGRMHVTTPARTDLGELRELNVIINIHSPQIKIRTDLFPYMGQNFSPWPYNGENFLDIYPRKIKETATEYGKRYEISYPFKYFSLGIVMFQSFLVVYEEEGKLKEYYIPNCMFFINSVTEKTTIEDIQPLPPFANVPMARIEEPSFEIYDFSKYKRMASWLLIFGFALITLSFVPAIIARLPRRDENYRSRKIAASTLIRLLDNVSISNWSEQYAHIYLKLNKLRIILGKEPLVNENCSDPLLRIIIGELNKVYQSNAAPDIIELNKNIRRFIKENVQ